ncbi:MAG: FixH family protein [Bacteroidota bacterium]
MNWGKGIILAMTTFITFIVVLIVIIMSNKVDLVSEDYYQREISFNDDIKAKNNFSETGKKFSLSQNESHLIATLPEIAGAKNFKLILSRPNDKNGDFSYEISQTKTYLIEKTKLEKGVYDYRLECEAENQTFLETGQYYLK